MVHSNPLHIPPQEISPLKKPRPAQLPQTPADFTSFSATGIHIWCHQLPKFLPTYTPSPLLES